jgi:hypothetical protein
MKEQNLAVVLRKYILEILTIFIGISMSFLFDEWRDDRKDAEILQKNLVFLKSNLVQDTIILSGMIDLGQKAIYCVDKLTYFQNESEVADSVDFYIDQAATYLTFNANKMAYEEMKLAANTNLIKNDTLKRAFLSYYSNVLPNCEEWCSVDKVQTMTHLIPEMTNYFPVVSDKLNVISAKEKVAAMKSKKLRNLMLMNLVYKKEVINTMIFTKKVAKKLLARVEKELK